MAPIPVHAFDEYSNPLDNTLYTHETENRSYYKANADTDEGFDDESNSVPIPEYENEADPIEKQFYNILRQHTDDDAKEQIWFNNAEERIPANDAEGRVPANDAEKRILANDERN